MNKTEVFCLDRRFKRLEKPVKNVVLRILRLLKKKQVGVEIYLVDGRKMRLLNKKFRRRNKAADVLSFTEPKEFPKIGKFNPLGEIYLNVRELKNRSRADFLLIHGILHLLGYDHERKNDRIKMEKKEAGLLNKLVSWLKS